MRTVLWTIGWILVGVWSLFVLVGFGIVGVVGDVARDVSGHVPGFPDEIFSVPWIAELVQRTGRFALFVVWLLGAAVILAVPGLLSLLIPRRLHRPAHRLPDSDVGRFPGPGSAIGPVPPVIGRDERLPPR